MNTSNTYRAASFAFAAIVTVAMLFGVNHLASSTPANGSLLSSVPAQGNA